MVQHKKLVKKWTRDIELLKIITPFLLFFFTSSSIILSNNSELQNQKMLGHTINIWLAASILYIVLPLFFSVVLLSLYEKYNQKNFEKVNALLSFFVALFILMAVSLSLYVLYTSILCFKTFFGFYIVLSVIAVYLLLTSFSFVASDIKKQITLIYLEGVFGLSLIAFSLGILIEINLSFFFILLIVLIILLARLISS